MDPRPNTPRRQFRFPFPFQFPSLCQLHGLAPQDARGMAADIALGVGVEAGGLLDAPVHGQGRARHGRLEVRRRFGLEGHGAKVDRPAFENLRAPSVSRTWIGHSAALGMG